MRSLKTYIVEDSAVIRENLIAALEEMTPLKVVGTAEDEATARQWFARPEHECDLAVVDIFLREGSGLGVLQALAGLPRRCKRVVLSNYATPAMRRKCIELGADAVFDKSGEIDALIGWCLQLAADGDAEPTGSGRS